MEIPRRERSGSVSPISAKKNEGEYKGDAITRLEMLQLPYLSLS